MTALGLRPSGRSGPSAGHRRSLAPPFSPEQLTGLVSWYKARDPQSTVAAGAVQQAAGSFRTPAAIALDADHNAGPFEHAEADVQGVAGATEVLSAADQQKPTGWAGAKWACET